MFTSTFWKQAGERAIKTAAQSVLSVWIVGDGILNALNLDWGLAGGVALGGAVASVLMSIVSVGGGEPASPSLVSIDRAGTPFSR